MNMKHLAAALLALSPVVASAQSVDLTVRGAIVPTTCTPTFTGGGTVNLGQHSSGALNTAAQTVLRDSDEVTLTIACGGTPAPVALQVLDNSAATVHPGLTLPGAVAGSAVQFGLGAVGGTNIGAYGIVAGAAQGDGAPASLLYKQFNADAAWVAETSPYLRAYTGAAGGYTSWGTGTTPVAADVHTLSMRVRPVIRNGADLPLSAEVPLTGSATFQVSYL